MTATAMQVQQITTLGENELHELTVAARESLKKAEAKFAAAPNNAALQAHVTMAQSRLNSLLGIKKPVKMNLKPTVAVKLAKEAVTVSTLAPGTRFGLRCNPAKIGRVIRQGALSVVVRYEGGETVTIGEKSFKGAGGTVTIAQAALVRAVEG